MTKKKKKGVAELVLDGPTISRFIRLYYNDNPDARWNGRQIRNACQTALALAEFEAQKLANNVVPDGQSVIDLAASSKKMIKVRMGAKHFCDVAKAYLAFMHYLKDVHGMSASQLAKNFRLRNDGHGLDELVGLLASRQANLETNTHQSYGQKTYGRQEDGHGQVRGRYERGQASQRLGSENFENFMGDMENDRNDEDDIFGQQEEVDGDRVNDEDGDFGFSDDLLEGEEEGDGQVDPFGQDDDDEEAGRGLFTDYQASQDDAGHMEDHLPPYGARYPPQAQTKATGRHQPRPEQATRRGKQPATDAAITRTSLRDRRLPGSGGAGERTAWRR